MRLHEEDKMMISHVRQQQDQQRRAKEMGKVHENQLARQRAEKEFQREQDYREYYRQIDENQRRQVRSFGMATRSQNDRSMQINMWIDKNCREQEVLLAQKEDYERRIRDDNLRGINYTLQQQIAEKEMARRRTADDRRKDVNDMRFRVDLFRKMEMDQEVQRRANQREYSNQLSSQATIAHENRMSAYRLSEIEKKMNKHVFDDAALARGGAQVVRVNQSLNSIRSSPFAKNAQKSPPFAGVFKDAPFQRITSGTISEDPKNT